MTPGGGESQCLRCGEPPEVLAGAGGRQARPGQTLVETPAFTIRDKRRKHRAGENDPKPKKRGKTVTA